jgi:hypothetical protein
VFVFGYLGRVVTQSSIEVAVKLLPGALIFRINPIDKRNTVSHDDANLKILFNPPYAKFNNTHIFAHTTYKDKTKMAKYGTAIWVMILAAFAAFLIIPSTHQLFVSATSSHPYIMGFIKFAILSTMGEFLATRLVFKRWQMVPGMLPKMFIWGVLGVLIVMMFSVYADGVSGAINKGLLWTGGLAGGSGMAGGFLAKLLKALYISAIMNLTFAPVFMAAHRITDTWIDARSSGNNAGKNSAGQKMTISGAISVIDWSGFLKFVVGKTIPLFWIPAHTITFLLPDTYKVIFAASLSIVLGLILSFAKMRSASV